MLRPTPEQGSELRAGRISPVGGHTVGAPDGGNGLPGVGWSTQHGDLRIPHFFGMHAFQIVPALSWLLTRRRRSKQVEIVFANRRKLSHTAGDSITLRFRGLLRSRSRFFSFRISNQGPLPRMATRNAHKVIRKRDQALCVRRRTSITLGGGESKANECCTQRGLT